MNTIFNIYHSSKPKCNTGQPIRTELLLQWIYDNKKKIWTFWYLPKSPVKNPSNLKFKIYQLQDKPLLFLNVIPTTHFYLSSSLPENFQNCHPLCIVNRFSKRKRNINRESKSITLLWEVLWLSSAIKLTYCVSNWTWIQAHEAVLIIM